MKRIVIIILLISITQSYAVKPGFMVYDSSSSGIPDNFVYDVAIDNYGSKWVGSNEGLSQYNNYNWIVCSTSIQEDSADYVSCVSVHNETIWFGKRKMGLFSHYHNINNNYDTTNSEIPSNHVFSLEINNNGDIWVGTDSGLARFNTDWEIWNEEETELTTNQINTLYIDQSDILWIGTDKGLFKFKDNVITAMEYKDIFINDIEVDIEGNLWLCTKNGLYKNDILLTDPIIPSKNITSIAIGDDNIKWIGTDSGLVGYNDTVWVVYDTSNTDLPVNFIHCICYEGKDIFWLGTMGGGLVKFNPKGFPQPISLSSNAPFCEGQVLELTAIKVEAAEYLWRGPNGFTSNIQNPVIDSSELSMSGWYYCEALTEELRYYDSIYVTIHPKPDTKIEPLGAVTLCDGTDVELTVKNYNANSIYEWSTGEYSQVIIIDTPGVYYVKETNTYGCVSYDSIEVEKTNIDITLDNPLSTEFGETCINDIIQHILKVTNQSEEAIDIGSVQLVKNSNIFNVFDKDVPGGLMSGESFDLPVVFTPLEQLVYYDTLVINIASPCEKEFVFALYGTGIKPNVILSLPDTTARPGDMLRLPIIARYACEKDTLIHCDISAEISFDAGIFLPKIVSNGVMDSMWINYSSDKSERVLRIQADNLLIPKNNYIISEIAGRVLFADSLFSNIIFDQLECTNNEIEIDTYPGSITLYPVCAQYLRNIELFSPPTIRVQSNPVHDVLTVIVENNDSEKTDISIYSLTGNLVSSHKYSTKNQTCHFQADINIENIPRGAYFLLVKSQAHILTMPLIVL